MPRERLPMRKINDVLRLHAVGLSKRRIAVGLNIGRTAVGDYLPSKRPSTPTSLRSRYMRRIACRTNGRERKTTSATPCWPWETANPAPNA